MKTIPATAAADENRKGKDKTTLQDICSSRKYTVYSFVEASTTTISTCHVCYLGSLVRKNHMLT